MRVLVSLGEYQLSLFNEQESQTVCECERCTFIKRYYRTVRLILVYGCIFPPLWLVMMGLYAYYGVRFRPWNFLHTNYCPMLQKWHELFRCLVSTIAVYSIIASTLAYCAVQTSGYGYTPVYIGQNQRDL